VAQFEIRDLFGKVRAFQCHKSSTTALML
jgi:hypothetical protein